MIANTMIVAALALTCSNPDLVQKQKAYGAVKAAYARDPGGDAARRAKLEAVIARYADLKNSPPNGSYIIDMLCKEHDELLAIYK